jgi:hypothetical protein
MLLAGRVRYLPELPKLNSGHILAAADRPIFGSFFIGHNMGSGYTCNGVRHLSALHPAQVFFKAHAFQVKRGAFG